MDEIPQVSIEAAVRLTFFAPASENFVLELATTLKGPWQPLKFSITDANLFP